MPAKTEMKRAREQRILAKLFYPGFWYIAFVATRKPRRRR